MNRTDRLYAIVEELRAASPRGRSARWLADRFGVSARTVERDLDALVQGGIPLRTESGAYVLDLGQLSDEDTPQPPAAPARPAAKVTHHADTSTGAASLALIEDAIAGRRVLHLDYQDRTGATTRRVVEPHGFVGAGARWYLIAWCRLRDEVRGFRLDRIQRVLGTDEPAEPRELTAEDYEIPAYLLTTLAPKQPRRSSGPRTAPSEPEAEPPQAVPAPRPQLYAVTTPPG